MSFGLGTEVAAQSTGGDGGWSSNGASPGYQWPGTNSPPPAPAAGSTTPGSAPASALPGGTALQPGNIGATAPLPYQSFGNVAQISPTYIDPANAQAYYQQYSQMQQQGLTPYFQQQQEQLAESNAARGIQDSGAASYLQGNLLGQQSATLASADAPLVSQAFGYNQAADTQNAQAGNNASVYNANAYSTAVGGNASAYNNYLNELLGLGSGNASALQAAYLNSFGPNSGVTSSYGNELSGTGSTFGNVYSNTLNAQNQAVGEGFSALGTFLGGGP